MRPYGINIVQAKLDIAEIQSDSFETIAIDKAKKSFEILNEPLFINDAAWVITALNGFPGPFMKYVNNWFSAEDFINLMLRHKNREVILRDTIVYINGSETKVFSYENKGVLLQEVKGDSGLPSARVISLSKNGLSISEENEKGSFYLESEQKIWKDFADWLNENK